MLDRPVKALVKSTTARTHRGSRSPGLDLIGEVTLWQDP